MPSVLPLSAKLPCKTELQPDSLDDTGCLVCLPESVAWVEMQITPSMLCECRASLLEGAARCPRHSTAASRLEWGWRTSEDVLLSKPG